MIGLSIEINIDKLLDSFCDAVCGKLSFTCNGEHAGNCDGFNKCDKRNRFRLYVLENIVMDGKGK